MDEFLARAAFLWNEFIAWYCKVDVVCWAGKPNWLGWLVMVLGVGYIFRVVLSTMFRKDA